MYEEQSQISENSVSPQTSTTTNVTSPEHTSGIENGQDDKSKVVHKETRKPLAYYVPLGNYATPIRIGTRILKEKLADDSLNKENRNILANYMSALDVSSIKINRKKKLYVGDPDGVRLAKRVEDPAKSLREALYERKPYFIKNSRKRVEILREIKEERCERDRQRRQWIQDHSNSLPKNQNWLENVPANVAQTKPRRLFDYHEMVRETRKKFERLPEQRMSRLEAKRKSNYRTNHLMAEIYKRNLKDKAVKGKVSMMHYENIINY